MFHDVYEASSQGIGFQVRCDCIHLWSDRADVGCNGGNRVAAVVPGKSSACSLSRKLQRLEAKVALVVYPQPRSIDARNGVSRVGETMRGGPDSPSLTGVVRESVVKRRS